jgi:hypothetical protein
MFSAIGPDFTVARRLGRDGYDYGMTNRDEGTQRTGRWVRRELRRKAERERLQKHGGALRRVYLDAVRKRAAAKKKG